jgi:uncharacterized membrane protein
MAGGGGTSQRTYVPVKQVRGIVVAVQEAHVDGIRRAYFVGFVAVLIGCFTPLKALGYVLPGLFTLWMALHGGVQRSRMFAIVVAIAVGAAAYDVIVREFLLVNYLVAIVTYSTVVPILVIDNRWLASRALLDKMLAVMAPMILLQGAIGIVQAVYGAVQSGTFSSDNGDRVAGTIYPHLDPENTFSNPMFAVNMAMMLLVCLSLPSALDGFRRKALIVGAVSLVLASVVHVLAFLVCAIVVAVFLVRAPRSDRERRGPRNRLLIALVLIAGFSYVVLPENVGSISHVAETVLDLEAVDIPRAIMLGRVLIDLPDEDAAQPYVGLGPGQFSSRASLIMSGVYLGGDEAPRALPFVTPRVTRLANDYCIALMIANSDAEAAAGTQLIGSSQQPFFSWLDIYTETGLLGMIVVFGSIAHLLLRVSAHARRRPEVRFPALLCAAGILLLVLIGWQAAYWEIPQAILIGVLALKVLYANVMYPLDDDPAVKDQRASGDATTTAPGSTRTRA